MRGEYPTFLKATTRDGQYGLGMRGTAGNETTPEVLYCANRLGKLKDTRRKNMLTHMNGLAPSVASPTIAPRWDSRILGNVRRRDGACAKRRLNLACRRLVDLPRQILGVEHKENYPYYDQGDEQGAN